MEQKIENLKKTAEATEESIKLIQANIANKEVQTRIAQFQDDINKVIQNLVGIGIDLAKKVAPTYLEGEDFIKWCRKVSRRAFLLAKKHGETKAREILFSNRMEMK